MTVIVNLYGGPGTGKSTTAAHLFALLKQRGVNAELVTEYAKDRTWEEGWKTLENQLYIFAKQHHRLWRVINQVDVVITDSPLLQSLHYMRGSDLGDPFKTLVRAEHARWTTLDVFLERVKPYQPAGRRGGEENAHAIDQSILDILADECVAFVSMAATDTTALHILGYLQKGGYIP